MVHRTAWYVAAVLIAGTVTATSAQPNQPASEGIEIARAGSRPSAVGAADNFTGRVRIDSAFERSAPARVAGAYVTFEPNARTAWHTHPLGQTLIVTSGAGRVQEWGKPARDIHPGDIVWIAPGVKHWHGASSTAAMTHIAITEGANGKLVDWMEKVSDADYAARRP